MRSIFKHLVLFFFALSALQLHAQVTIGSAKAPIAGALLMLDDGTPDPTSIGVTASKGLGMPRVALQSTSGDLATSLDATATAGTLDKDAHTGLLIYNTNKQETANRLCPGLHVWDGDKWQPLTPYPDFGAVASLAGPTPDLMDSRNNGAEFNIYHTARFHTVIITGGSPYACDASNAPTTTVYDAGIWMTQNLNTKFAPTNTAIPLAASAGDGLDLATYAYPRPSTEPNATTAPSTWTTEQGLHYNWAAATVGTDGQHGKGGTNGLQNATDEGGANEGARIQGICPPNWHLPSDKEYTELVAAMTADPTLYTTAGSGITASQLGYIWMKKEKITDGSDTGGRSLDADKGGFSALLAGYASDGSAYGYGSNGYLWGSSSNDGLNAWYRRVNSSSATVTRSYAARNLLFSVRCKKDTN